MMSNYSIFGPYNIPIQSKPSGRRISEFDTFWNKANELRKKCGCYVFAMSSSRNLIPYYVGKTTKGFEKECFSSHKMEKYNEALSEYKKGQPVMFFVVHPIRKGKLNEREIGGIEDFLIQLSVARNDGLLNIKGAKQPTWSISHVIRGRKGKPSKATQKFKKMLGIDKNVAK